MIDRFNGRATAVDAVGDELVTHPGCCNRREYVTARTAPRPLSR